MIYEPEDYARQGAKLAKEELSKFHNSGTWRSWRLGESFSVLSTQWQPT
jgi:hypothetical protein